MGFPLRRAGARGGQQKPQRAVLCPQRGEARLVRRGEADLDHAVRFAAQVVNDAPGLGEQALVPGDLAAHLLGSLRGVFGPLAEPVKGAVEVMQAQVDVADAPGCPALARVARVVGAVGRRPPGSARRGLVLCVVGAEDAHRAARMPAHCPHGRALIRPGQWGTTREDGLFGKRCMTCQNSISLGPSGTA